MRTSHRPGAWATHGTAAITLLAFLLALVSGMNDVLAYVAGFIPARAEYPDLLDHMGLGMPVVPFPLTPLSATLLHGNWLHLGFNLLMFVFCGRQVEMVLGGRLVLLLYLVGAYAAALGQWVLDTDLAVPMIGASGAISAIIGAYALLFSNREVKPLGPIPAYAVRMLWLGAGWVFLQFLIGVATRGDGPRNGRRRNRHWRAYRRFSGRDVAYPALAEDKIQKNRHPHCALTQNREAVTRRGGSGIMGPKRPPFRPLARPAELGRAGDADGRSHISFRRRPRCVARPRAMPFPPRRSWGTRRQTQSR